MRELFGAPPDSPVTYADNYLTGVHPDDREAADAAVQMALDPNGPGVFDIEYRLSNAPIDQPRWLAARGRAVVERGRTVRFVGTVIDISERRRAEDQLRTAEERYRLASRATNDAIWDWDLLTNHVSWNEALETAHGHSPADVAPTGDWWIEHIHPDDRERISHSIHEVIDGAENAWANAYRFERADGSYASVADRGYVLRNAAGRAVRMIGAMLDVSVLKATEQRQAALIELVDRLRTVRTSADATGIASEILGRTLRVARAGYSRIDLAAELFEVERDWVTEGVTSLEGKARLGMFDATIKRLRSGSPLVSGDIRKTHKLAPDLAGYEAIGARAQIKIPLIEHGHLVGVLYVHAAQPRAWTEDEIMFAQAVADRTYAALSRLKGEAYQQILNREISHRLKNLLAMVQAIATQTLRNTPDPAAAREILAARLAALGKAHDVLMSDDGQVADVSTVIREAVKIQNDKPGRFRISGPQIICGARAALSLTLMIHELATNAAKYGALTTAEGVIDVSWSIDGEDEDAQLTLCWRENGGPSVTPPTKKGFGSRLIERGLAGAVGGEVDMRYHPTGLECVLEAPVSGFTADT